MIGSLVEFFKDYFHLPIERYFYINLIPGYNNAKIFDSLFFYLIIILAVALIPHLSKIFIFERSQKINFTKSVLYFLLIFWLITSLRWFSIEARWLKNDFNDFKGKIDSRAIVLSRLVRSAGLPPEWLNFYDFLKFVQKEIPPQSTAYFLSDQFSKTFSKYWFYPRIKLVDQLPADYLLLFNVLDKDNVLSKEFKDFKFFKVFNQEGYILKYSL